EESLTWLRSARSVRMRCVYRLYSCWPLCLACCGPRIRGLEFHLGTRAIPGYSCDVAVVLEQHRPADARGTTATDRAVGHDPRCEPTRSLCQETDAGRSWRLSRKNATERACCWSLAAPGVQDRESDLRESTSLLRNREPLFAHNRASTLSSDPVPFGA